MKKRKRKKSMPTPGKASKMNASNLTKKIPSIAMFLATVVSAYFTYRMYQDSVGSDMKVLLHGTNIESCDSTKHYLVVIRQDSLDLMLSLPESFNVFFPEIKSTDDTSIQQFSLSYIMRSGKCRYELSEHYTQTAKPLGDTLIKYRCDEAVVGSNSVPQPFDKLIVGDGSYLYMNMTANCRRRKSPLNYSFRIKVVQFADTVYLSESQRKKVQETRNEVRSSPKLAEHEEFYMSHYIWSLAATDYYSKQASKYDDVFYLYDDESIQSTKDIFGEMLNK